MDRLWVQGRAPPGGSAGGCGGTPMIRPNSCRRKLRLRADSIGGHPEGGHTQEFHFGRYNTAAGADADGFRGVISKNAV